MEDLKVIKRADSPTVDQIHDLESVIGTSLPNDYRHFLKDHNPKTTLERLIILDGNEYIIHNWLPLSPKEEISLLNTFEWTKDLLLGKYLAFALDSGDWLFVMGITKRDYGKIFFAARIKH